MTESEQKEEKTSCRLIKVVGRLRINFLKSAVGCVAEGAGEVGAYVQKQYRQQHGMENSLGPERFDEARTCFPSIIIFKRPREWVAHIRHRFGNSIH